MKGRARNGTCPGLYSAEWKDMIYIGSEPIISGVTSQKMWVREGGSKTEFQLH